MAWQTGSGRRVVIGEVELQLEQFWTETASSKMLKWCVELTGSAGLHQEKRLALEQEVINKS